jgi:hypothetical protein
MINENNMSQDQESKGLSFREFCERMGWGYPLPHPKTAEAQKWIADRMEERK